MLVRLRRGGHLLLALLFFMSAVASASVVPLMPITAEEGQRALEEAIRFATIEWHTDDEVHVGVPYQWGGRASLAEFRASVEGAGESSPLGVDASGLVIVAFRSLSPDLRFRIPRGEEMVNVLDVNSSLLFEWNVVPVELEDLRQGDLIFFSGSSGLIEGVGIYERIAGRHLRFVVASANSGRVVRTSLNLDGEYWATRFAGAGRLLRSEAQ